MPLAVRPMGLPGAQIIPDGWTDTHGDVIAGTWTATCRINAPDVQGPYDPDLGYSPQVPGAERYAGACRVQARPVDDRAQQSGGQEVTTQDYLIVVPRSVDPSVDDLVTVTAADDAAVVGRRFTITSVAYGSLAWERDLICTLDLG